MLRVQLPEWNQTWMDYSRDLTIAAAFEQQVALAPDRVAIVAGMIHLSYRELNDRADCLALRLRGRGVRPETLVGIALNRSEWLLVGMLAVLKAGAAYVPLDPDLPSQRLRWMVEDSRMQLLITTNDLENQFAAISDTCQILNVRSEANDLDAESVDSQDARSHNLAYLMYTSGSTGKPKGVMVEHRNVVNFMAGMDRAIGDKSGVMLAVTSVSFDISVLELLWTLTRGFTVVLHDSNDFTSVAEEVEMHKVTHLQMTPSLARILTMDQRVDRSLASLSHILLGGEAVPASLIHLLRRVFRGEIYNMYGPTETTIWSTACKLGEIEQVVPIGKPIANTQVYILDSSLEPVPQGEVGELFIAGDGLARGYWNRADLTEQSFIPMPWAMDERMYRTGDLARFLPDGNIECLGRADYQIKLRGHRIEPGEIESNLEQCPGIRQAVVVKRVDREGDERLLAYLVAESSQVPEKADLVAALGSRLPEYMVPSAFIFLAELPLTSNGKIDRKALLGSPMKSAQESSANRGLDSRPLEVMEATVADAWQKALGISTIHVDDNFFDLGAHSLIVAEVHSRLQNDLSREIPLIDLYQYTTVRALAAQLTGSSAANKLSDRALRRRMARSN